MAYGSKNSALASSTAAQFAAMGTNTTLPQVQPQSPLQNINQSQRAQELIAQLRQMGIDPAEAMRQPNEAPRLPVRPQISDLDIQRNPRQALQHAISSNDENLARRIIQNVSSQNLTSPEFLQAALDAQAYDVARILLENGANPTLSARPGTPEPFMQILHINNAALMKAACYNPVQISEFTLGEHTLFDHAIMDGLSQTVKGMIDGGVTPFAMNSRNELPIWIAAKSNHPNTLKTLLDNVDYDKGTLQVSISMAIQAQKPQNLQILCQALKDKGTVPAERKMIEVGIYRASPSLQQAFFNVFEPTMERPQVNHIPIRPFTASWRA